ncbi:MAG: GH1 family beta-glucosidase [Vicingaceae bacterium]
MADFSSPFPPNFYWGASSSAYQTEGVSPYDGKGLSIWDDFAKQKGKIKHGQHAREATKFIKHYRQDIHLLKWMNFGNFRFSIAWSRIFPEGIGKINQTGVDFYHRLIDSCLNQGIEPWITLYHWDLPLVLEEKGGWVNREVLDWFADYAAFCIREFGDKVKHWMVLNEPTAFTGLGYFMGIHAPGKKGLKNFLPAMHHTILAQAEVGRLIKSMNSNLSVGTTFSFSQVVAFTEKQKDIRAAQRVDALLNRLFLEPLLGLGYPLEELRDFSKVERYVKVDDEQKMAFDYDFIGVQNYSREIIKSSIWMPIVKAKLVTAEKRKVERTAMDWENYPQALYHVLKDLKAYPNLPPLVVTETGIALEDKVSNEGTIPDQKRIAFYKRSTSCVRKAIQEGVDVRGYFAWSLTDNFEWAEGYRPRFGLVHIEYDKQKRVPKDSAFWFKNFLSAD